MIEAAVAVFAFFPLASVLPWVFLAWSVLATLAHTRQEIYGAGGPIWTYLRLPVRSNANGYDLLLAFGLLQIGLADFGYARGYTGALTALAVIRLTDCVVSHWLPTLTGKRPNPGLTTTPLYAADAAFAALVLSGRLY